MPTVERRAEGAVMTETMRVLVGGAERWDGTEPIRKLN